MDNFNDIIENICHELNIKLSYTSDKWVKVLEKDNKVRYIQGYKFDLNHHGIGSIIDDKGLFYDICKIKDIPIINHYVIFKDYDKDQILNYFHQNNNILIVKGNIGTCGNEVYKVESKDELFNIIDDLLLSQYSISLCPYYEIKNEYRTIYLNKELRIIYGKEKPFVIGDGISNIKELAIKYNDYYKNHMIDSNYIPKNNEKVILNYQFNLSRGAKMFLDIDDELKKRIISLSQEVIEKLDLSFVSVDIIHTVDNKLLIMEANSGIMMDNFIRFNYDKQSDVYNLYCDAIKTMFE